MQIKLIKASSMTAISGYLILFGHKVFIRWFCSFFHSVSQCRNKGRGQLQGNRAPSLFTTKVKTDMYKMLKIKSPLPFILHNFLSFFPCVFISPIHICTSLFFTFVRLGLEKTDIHKTTSLLSLRLPLRQHSLTTS